MKKVNLIWFSMLAVILFGIAACGSADAQVDENVQSKQSVEDGKKSINNGFDKMPPVGTSAYCPIMKHDFKVTDTTESSVHNGKTYVFCCPGCKPQFEKEPTKYI